MTVLNFPGVEDRQTSFDVICFCHLRWDFVFQRPQHLMTRFAKKGRVFIIEEPTPSEDEPRLDVSDRGDGVFVCVPMLPGETKSDEVVPGLIQDLIREHSITNYIDWFYTPMMLNWADGLRPLATVYDCMDELSAFRGAPPELVEKERKLFELADVVFTGGQSLYEAKREQHENVHAFPSSIDAPHFGRARTIAEEFPQQADIPHPRIGFVGVIDERMDIPMVAKAAELRPDWQFVMVGPVVKIDEADLPRPHNVHYLGQQNYEDLPAILAGWDVAVMPFALNESTRYISPTKTPEYLAAGLPVVSTAIKDVVTPYGDLDLVSIVATPEEFVTAVDALMSDDQQDRQVRADAYLSNFSWDKTFQGMYNLIHQAISERSGGPRASVEAASQ